MIPMLSPQLRRPLVGLALVSAAGTLAGCTVGPDFQRPSTSATAGYTAPDTHRTGPAVAEGVGPEARWWTAFGSAELTALVDRALANNRSLAASNATLERARARIAAVAGRRLPQVDANARIEHEQVNLAAFGFDPASFGGGAIGTPEFDLYTVGGGVRYDLDLFGANRRRLEQATAQAESQLRQTEAAHLTVAGRVVVQVLTIAAIRERIATTNTLLAEDRRNLTLTQVRQRAGAGTMVEVLSAQGQLAGDEADVPQLEQQLAEARNMLAILTGVSPAELGPTDFDFAHFALPASVPVALPSALVHKRPDILQAEADLHGAVAGVGIATAALYPDISIGATLSQSANVADDVFRPGSRGFDIFGGLTAPIFHGGTLRAEKRGAEAAARAAAASYEQTVLTAFGQVSDLLSALGNDARSVDTQQRSAGIAQRSLHLSRRSFEVGNSGILQVLDASRSYQRARMALVEAQARQFLNVARLYVATAGGWTGPAVASAETGSAK